MWSACRLSLERGQRGRLGDTSVPEHSILIGVLPCEAHSVSGETGAGSDSSLPPLADLEPVRQPGGGGGVCRCSSLGQVLVPNQTDKQEKEEGSGVRGRDQKTSLCIETWAAQALQVDGALEGLETIARSFYSSGFSRKHQPRDQI